MTVRARIQVQFRAVSARLENLAQPPVAAWAKIARRILSTWFQIPKVDKRIARRSPGPLDELFQLASIKPDAVALRAKIHLKVLKKKQDERNIAFGAYGYHWMTSLSAAR
jgi:hypothetical protein